jgi:aryl-alcohol dehydrogenase-like predicted oxidoreductase|nr:aldo/keto reductase [Kofleriaceae bacterium]
MRYRRLGTSGLRVSEIALGAMTFGDAAALADARQIYEVYRAAGGNFVDTANVYTGGASEQIVGELVAGHRDAMVIATKYTCSEAVGDVNAGGNHRKNMMVAVEASLRRLKTDYIDMYWLHVWDQLTPVDEVMRAFDDLVRQGKVLYVGMSDAPAWWCAQASTLAELRGWARLAAVQFEYSLLERSVEHELVPMATTLGLGMVAWAPLAGGVLSGKYHAGQGTGGRYERGPDRAARAGDRVDRIVRALGEVAGELGRPAAQVALAWLRHRAPSVIPICGARRAAQLADSLASLELALTAEQRATLDDASALAPGFPQSMYDRARIIKLVYAGMRDQLDA